MAARIVGSLPVASVQALAETCNRFNDNIPERYVRMEARSEEVIIGHGPWKYFGNSNCRSQQVT
jgi:HPt (histidine-containing phosphotransfer) domain-containing protein